MMIFSRCLKFTGTHGFFISFFFVYVCFHSSSFYGCCGCCYEIYPCRRKFSMPECWKCAWKRNIVCHRLSPKWSYSTRKRMPSKVIQLRNYESHYCNNDTFLLNTILEKNSENYYSRWRKKILDKNCLRTHLTLLGKKKWTNKRKGMCEIGG